MSTTTTATLDVSGATLHYDVRGGGPVLLLICGGVYDATAFAPLAEQLSDSYTVVTYDRRGNSRSRLDGDPVPQRIEEHSDDARRLLRAIGGRAGGPAYVFGNSSGAMIGLDLAVRHPELVRTLVAHEPPLFELLPERDYWRDVIVRVEEAFRAGGAGAAMGVFGAAFAPEGDDAAGRAPDGGGGEESAGGMDEAMMPNMEFFIGYEVPSFGRYIPDLAALRAAGTRVVPAVGEASAGEPMHRATVAVAERLGSTAVPFPGDHGGFGTEAAAFAARLHIVLSSNGSGS